MVTAVATATEMQNNFGHFIARVMNGEEIIVTRNGEEVGRFVPKDAVMSFLSDSLVGVVSGKASLDDARAARSARQ